MLSFSEHSVSELDLCLPYFLNQSKNAHISGPQTQLRVFVLD